MYSKSYTYPFVSSEKKRRIFIFEENEMILSRKENIEECDDDDDYDVSLSSSNQSKASKK